MANIQQETHISTQIKEWVSTQVFDDTTIDETKSSPPVNVSNCEAVSLIVETSSGVSGGVVKLEGAMSSDYAGTWLELGSITTAAASKVYGASVGLGATTGFPIKFVRARIETAISGGTVDAYIVTQK